MRFAESQEDKVRLIDRKPVPRLRQQLIEL